MHTNYEFYNSKFMFKNKLIKFIKKSDNERKLYIYALKNLIFSHEFYLLLKVN